MWQFVFVNYFFSLLIYFRLSISSCLIDLLLALLSITLFIYRRFSSFLLFLFIYFRLFISYILINLPFCLSIYHPVYQSPTSFFRLSFFRLFINYFIINLSLGLSVSYLSLCLSIASVLFFFFVIRFWTFYHLFSHQSIFLGLSAIYHPVYLSSLLFFFLFFCLSTSADFYQLFAHQFTLLSVYLSITQVIYRPFFIFLFTFRLSTFKLFINYFPINLSLLSICLLSITLFIYRPFFFVLVWWFVRTSINLFSFQLSLIFFCHFPLPPVWEFSSFLSSIFISV